MKCSGAQSWGAPGKPVHDCLEGWPKLLQGQKMGLSLQDTAVWRKPPADGPRPRTVALTLGSRENAKSPDPRAPGVTRYVPRALPGGQLKRAS